MSSLIRHGTQYTAKGTLFTTKTTDTAFLWNAGFFSGRKPKGLPTTCGWPCVSTGHCPVLGCTQEHFTLMLVLFQFSSQTSLFQLEPVNVYIRHVWAEWAVVIAAWLFTDDLWCKDNSSCTLWWTHSMTFVFGWLNQSLSGMCLIVRLYHYNQRSRLFFARRVDSATVDML